MTGYLTVKEVAALLNVSEDHVRGLIGDGRLRAVRVGRLLRVREDWIEEDLLVTV